MARERRVLTAGSVAVTGAVALVLGGAPAVAAESESTLPYRSLPSSLPERAGTGAPNVGHAGSAATTYTVQAGDTITGIAIRHGLRTVDVLTWNDLSWSSIIHPGDVLTLGAPGSGGGESGGGDSEGSAPAAPDQDADTYTVQAGDTLWGIAADHGLSLAKLLDLNGIDEGAIIYPGEELVVAEADGSESSDPPSIYDSPEYDLQASLNAPQAENVALIANVGRGLGVSEHGIAIAIATAMVESGLRNLDGGDRDSVGLFQQRPSTGWGDRTDLMDRGVATTRFFHGAPDGATLGLLDIPGWQSMDFGDAAQAVQISAYPDRYDRWRVAAWGWLAQHG